jgi:hypothetical protein
MHTGLRSIGVICSSISEVSNNGGKYGQRRSTLFYIDCEEVEDQELESPQDLDLEESTQTMSCLALDGISTP